MRLLKSHRPDTRQNLLWLAPYVAIGLFAFAMLVLTALLQWQEQDTARAALEGDLHWAERTIEAHLRGHRDFLAELARDQEYRQLDYEAFQVRASRFVGDNGDIGAIAWVDPDGKIAWVAPFETPVTFVGDQLTGTRLSALNDALRVRRATFTRAYTDGAEGQTIDLIFPVQRSRSDLGAFVAIVSLNRLLRVTLPGWFAAKYSLTLVDADQREILSNTSVQPTDRSLSGKLNIDLPDTRLGLEVVAYRHGGAWAAYVPATIIGFLTLLTTGTLVMLRRHARQRATTEAQLQDAYAFRQAMSESMLTGLRAIDLKGRITFVNTAFCRMTGFDEQELLGLAPPYPYWPPEEFARLQENIDQALAGHAPAKGFEMRIMRKNGERFDVRLYFSPLIDADGRQIGWMASMNDITEPRRARHELERAHERFVTVIEGLDAAVHVAAADTGEILFANRAFQLIFGFDTVGRSSPHVTAACRPDDTELAHEPATLNSDQLPAELFDGEIQHALSGHWYHIHERAIRWVDGRTVRVQIATDITDKKHIEAVTLEQQKRLEQTSRLITMGEMASSLAHELNQPLSAIANYCAGCIKRLQSGAQASDDILLALKKAADQAERAGKIIRRMRDMVKKEEPRRQSYALAELVDETRAFVDIEAQKAGVSIVLDLPEKLPPVVVDRIMIEQLLLNLQKNAIEAMFATPPLARQVTIAARVLDHKQVEVTISDHGHGLSEHEREKIFTPFYTTKPDGMGIGLAICRSIVEFHQGRLWAEPNPAGGTRFHFTLPCDPADINESPEAEAL